MKTRKSIVLSQHHEIFYFMLAAILPVFFVLTWLSANSQLPTADATDFLATGHAIYRHFTDHGFWYGLLHFDIERGWRPIFFSIFTVPFLLISKGNLSFAYHAVAISCVIASAVYVYLFSRILLDRVSATIVANLICLLPLVQIPVLTFFAESALFPMVIGALYHLIRSDYFRVKKQMYGFIICFSLAIVIRPVEAVTELFFVLIVFLSAGWYQKIFSLKQIVSVIALAFSALFLLLFIAGAHFIRHYPFHPIDGGVYDIKLALSIHLALTVTMCCVILAWAGIAWMNFASWGRRLCIGAGKPLNDPPIIFAFAVIFTLVILWFWPYAFRTYVWVYRTSFGDLADMSVNMLLKQPVWNVLQNFTGQESAIIVKGVLSVALAGLIIIPKKTLRSCFSQPFIYLLLLIPFPVWEVLNTVQTAPRKLNLAFPALILVLLCIGLQQGKLWRWRIAAVTMLLALQFGFALSFVYPIEQFKPYASLLGNYPKPVRIQPNPHDDVFKFLNQQAKQYQLKHIAIESNADIPFPIDPFLLIMMNRVNQENYKMGYPYFSIYSDEAFQKISEGNDGVFLTDKKADMVVSETAAKAYHQRFESETNATLKAMYRFLYFYAMNKLDIIGWKLGPCMTTRANDNNVYLGCLLVKKN